MTDKVLFFKFPLFHCPVNSLFTSWIYCAVNVQYSCIVHILTVTRYSS